MTVVGAQNTRLAPLTETLLRRMVSPLSGVAPEINFVMRSAHDPAVGLAVVEMGTDDGYRRGGWSRLTGTHHIAGIGATYNETVIRCLAEALERYAQSIWSASNPHKLIFASYDDMQAQCRVLMPQGLQFFSDHQLERPGFPFSRLRPDQRIGWLPARSLVHDVICWLPAQIAVVGYVLQAGEPRIMSAVTTGTAAHRGAVHALNNGLLELVQADAAMGHWYGNGTAFCVQHDHRTEAVRTLIERHLRPGGQVPRFYWLCSADLPGFTFVCVLESDEMPRAVVGIACDLRVSKAMYRAFLEATAVTQLFKARVLRGGGDEIDPSQIYDFESNVLLHATGSRSAFGARFGVAPSVGASDLPEDIDVDVVDSVRHLIDAFRRSGKELVCMDLTTNDIRELGFCVIRVWSPDTISLSLPSAPPATSARCGAYGGIVNADPHPYA